jgi:hypothetical protein
MNFLQLKMVEVFKTNVQREGEAKMLLLKLSELFPTYKINFDLDDCDKILRVEGNNILPEIIMDMLTTNNYQCVVLD